jgi:Fe-S-cluster containining protein
MSELVCGECTICCQWGGDELIRPELSSEEALLLKGEVVTRIEGTQVNSVTVLAMKENGDCIYLEDKGCTVYKDRPFICRIFDCRESYEGLKDRSFVRVLFQGRVKALLG